MRSEKLKVAVLPEKVAEVMGTPFFNRTKVVISEGELPDSVTVRLVIVNGLGLGSTNLTSSTVTPVEPLKRLIEEGGAAGPSPPWTVMGVNVGVLVQVKVGVLVKVKVLVRV
jgi:hypothetical protein